MSTSYESRLGSAPEEAVKAPVVAITTENIALTGTPAITLLNTNTYQTVVGDRILVAAQDDASEHGIYDVQSGAWTRSTDWNDSQDVINGILVSASQGPYLVQGTYTGDFAIDTTEITFNYLALTMAGDQVDITDVQALVDEASDEATAAAASATAAASSATSAAASAASAASSLSSVDDAVVQVRYIKEDQIASQGQTLFTLSNAFDPGYIEVYLNGVLLQESDYDDTESPDITLNFAANAGDELVFRAWGVISIQGSLLATNNLSDLTDPSVARDSLELGDAATGVLGTDVQAQDAELQAIADLASSANKIIRYTSIGVADLIDFKDEDDMISDSATAVASQQSIKAYVDAEVGSGSGLGIGQTMTDVSGSRALSTTYTNSTGKPIVAFISLQGGANANLYWDINGQQVARTRNQFGDRTVQDSFTLIIADGDTYAARVTKSGVILTWWELR